MIEPANDDQVFEAPGDEQLAVTQETKVARTEEWTIARVSQITMKGVLRLARTVPVTTGDTWSSNPYLTYSARLAVSQGIRLNNSNCLGHCPATNQRLSVFTVVGRFHYAAFLQCRAL